MNVSTIVASNEDHDPRKQKSFAFALNLAPELILPQIKQRQLTGLLITNSSKNEANAGMQVEQQNKHVAIL